MAAIHARSASARERIRFTNILLPDPRPLLKFTDDGPGHLSVYGPRHDNDHADYRAIQILPTTDEILSVSRPTYMPQKDLATHNHLAIGMRRHLDLLFRQLRCDSVEAIKDICYSAAQLAFLATQRVAEDQVRHETSAGNRYFLYRTVHVEELLAHESKGLLVRLSYHCPTFMRGASMHNSGRFEEGMLVAILELDNLTNELSVYFMEVHLAQSTFSMSSCDGTGQRSAVQLSFPPSCNRDSILQLCRHALRLCPGSELVLVEFPKALYAGFYNCLDRLQRMRETDVAFSQYVAPSSDVQDVQQAMRLHRLGMKVPELHVPPPKYASAPDYAYKLASSTPTNSNINMTTIADLLQEEKLHQLQEQTSLDAGQAVAFRDSLSREFAFTQGPPGCGKTFLGVQLTKTLLQSRSRAKPIILVCLTNHALDNFLSDLQLAGVEKLLRIGSGSKEEWTSAINLHSRSRKTRFTRDEFAQKKTHDTHKKEKFTDLDASCKALSSQNRNGTVSWYYVQASLERNYPGIHAQFSGDMDNPIAQAFTFEYWSMGGDLDNLKTLHVELASRLTQVSMSHDESVSTDVHNILLEISDQTYARSSEAGSNSVWNLDLGERRRLLREWEDGLVPDQIAHKITALYLDYQNSVFQIKKIKNQKDARTMLAHNVIGMTTTACAGRWEVLQSLELELLICEEAAEVMEAHTVCSLLPTLQHAIFIGDPLQLRPEVNEQALTLETSIGARYRLDESLLERLMFPKDPAQSTIPASTLDIQRRMHPQIANIARLTYPLLKDHESTYDRPPVCGIEKRMFWWDHRVPELEMSDVSKSHANTYEVEMVAGLVEYLLRGGNYSQNEIAVLTPYSGQLAKLHERLAKTCDIWLSDKDREELLAEDLLALGEEGRITKDEIAMSEMLRLTSIDNFQGEEAKVIILSTVRSGNGPGFLKTTNRINVACSRAREGFYVIGNSQTLSQVPMWRKVIATFDGNIGAFITTCCHMHPGTSTRVYRPGDFANVKECPFMCNQTLACGHACAEKCHPASLHERLTCHRDCLHVHPCGHKCLKLCYQTCGKCDLSVDDILLGCGHQGTQLCSGEESICKVVKLTKTLHCHHQVDILCGEDSDVHDMCQQRCTEALRCGHLCPGTCGQCSITKEHPECSKVCNWQKPCGHKCTAICHSDKPCPKECSEPCPDSCEHGFCKNRCSNLCDPCVKSQKSRCADEVGPDTICCLPRTSLPCTKPCDKTLGCGHICPSIHGEVCPPKELCPWCATGAKATAPMLYMPDCGHITEIKRLDKLNCRSLYKTDDKGGILAINAQIKAKDLREPKCTCGVKCPSVYRYSAVGKLLKFTTTLDLLVAMLGRKMNHFARAIDSFELSLANNFDLFMQEIRPNPLAATANTHRLLRRDRDVLHLHKQIVCFRNEVVDQVERSVQNLHITFPNIVPAHAMTFHTRFDILEYRSMAMRISDNLKLANQLLKLNDPSHGVQRQGLKMLQFVSRHSMACVRYCQDALSRDIIITTTPLAVELRLQQAQFHLFVKVSNAQIASSGYDSDHSPPPTDRDIVESLREIQEVSGSTFLSRGALMQTAKAFENYILGFTADKPLSVPKINIETCRRLEKAWAQHEPGGLTNCKNRHLYSRKSFREGCPDCAQVFAAPAAENTVINFREADFLAAIRGLSVKKEDEVPAAEMDTVELKLEKLPRPLSEIERRELLEKEKFLAAMRKVGC